MSLCCCDPEKEYNLDCFAHGHSEKMRKELLGLEKTNRRLRKKLRLAMRLINYIDTDPEGSDWTDAAKKTLYLIKKVK